MLKKVIWYDVNETDPSDKSVWYAVRGVSDH